MRAYALVLPPRSAFSHITAADLLNLSLPQEYKQARPLHATTDTSGWPRRRKGLKGHRRPPDPSEVIQRSEVWVTNPLRTWRDLAALLTIDGLVVVADELLRHDWCTPDDLMGAVGPPHTRKLTSAARLARVGSLSPKETLLRINVGQRGLPEPTLKEDIIEDGIWIGCGDLVWRTWRVIADYDGDHHDGSGQRHQDAQTRVDYVAADWRHIAVTKKMSDHDAVDRIERALRERGWRP